MESTLLIFRKEGNMKKSIAASGSMLLLLAFTGVANAILSHRLESQLWQHELEP